MPAIINLRLTLLMYAQRYLHVYHQMMVLQPSWSLLHGIIEASWTYIFHMLQARECYSGAWISAQTA